jgi:tetratricopeptide (TPR) repeat protein
MSVIANVVPVSSGTDKMSRMRRRVKPIEPAPIIAILMGLFITSRIVAGGTAVADLPDFEKLWNYNDPAATERTFRELLPAAEKSGDLSYHVQLLTQIARTQGLQDRFDDACATLDAAEKMLRDDLKLARVRCLLERGRVFNSSGQPAKAMPLFEQSWKLAEADKFPRYAIDAIHMLALAAPTPKEQIDWNLRGIAMVEKEPIAEEVASRALQQPWRELRQSRRLREGARRFRKARRNQRQRHVHDERPGPHAAPARPGRSGNGNHPPDSRAARKRGQT